MFDKWQNTDISSSDLFIYLFYCFIAVGPPYIFYFGVKFYAENPSKLKEETTR